MESLKIDSGSIKLAVNGDEGRLIEFNPEDVVFVEKFYGLIKELEEKEIEFRKRSQELAVDNSKLDEHGVPLNTGDNLQLVIELCNYLRGRIDYVFGPGTSKTAFGDLQTLNMFEQFFLGIVPHVKKARAKKVSRYKNEYSNR